MRKFRVPSYRLHKPSGRGVVTVGGKLVYLPGEFRSEESQAAYRRVLRDKLHSDIVDLPTKFAESIAQHGNPTLRSLLAAYLLHAERTYVDPATGKVPPEIAHLKVVIEVMNEIAGDLAARDFGPLKLQSCQRAFVARATPGRPSTTTPTGRGGSSSGRSRTRSCRVRCCTRSRLFLVCAAGAPLRGVQGGSRCC